MDHREVAFGLSVCEGCRVTPYADQQHFELAVSKDNVAQVTTAKEISPFPWTAVAGTPQLINNGEVAISDSPSPLVAARTAVGLSSSSAGSPPQYLYLLTIDGLENSNSPYYGATFQDLAGWLLLAGAYNGFALDGGGSTTMAQITAPGQPSLMNVPHDDEHSGNEAERAVAISLGVIVLRDGSLALER